ncbi:phosphoribosyl transferase domain protein, partial [Vibrio parahaemolyticus V-223/04]
FVNRLVRMRLFTNV